MNVTLYTENDTFLKVTHVSDVTRLMCKC